MPSILPPVANRDANPGCFPCNKSKCVVCSDHIVQTTTFRSNVTSESFTIRTSMNCETKNVVYLLFCSKCNKTQYIGETKNKLKQRFYLHRSNINKNTGTLVTQHFNQPHHTLQNMKCIAIEKIRSDSHTIRIARETFWIFKMQTLTPLGLNSIS